MTERVATPSIAPSETWQLRLYIAGETAKSTAAITNLTRICDEYLPGQFEIEVVDLLKDPKLARNDQIVAIPTLIRKLPNPVRKIIGDLSNTEKTLIGLQLVSPSQQLNSRP